MMFMSTSMLIQSEMDGIHGEPDTNPSENVQY